MSSLLETWQGVLLVDKPSGPTSYDLIRWVKRKAPGSKIGHAGTLDPMASGLMVLLFGKATKAQSLYMGHAKTYRLTARWGTRTDTGDLEGAVLETSETLPAPAAVAAALTGFLGEREQIPPMYSALKHKGTPLYKLARKGQVIDRPPRRIRIDSFELLGTRENEAQLRVRCSAGTYVRVLVEELAAALGTLGVLSALVREEIGDFRVADALPGDRLQLDEAESIRARLLPVA